jgi:hypothetical protein
MMMKNLHQILQDNAIKLHKLELFFQSPEIEIYGFAVSRLEAIETWKQLRQLFKETDCWPILLEDKMSPQFINLELDKYGTTEAIIKAGTELNAEIVAIHGGFLEFIVSRPPTAIEGALKLAQEHFVYCADVIYQGAGTLDRLVESLIDSNRWVFWWD